MRNVNCRRGKIWDGLVGAVAIGIAFTLLTTIFGIAVLQVCGSKQSADSIAVAAMLSQQEAPPLTRGQLQASDANGHFAVDLYRQLAKQESGKNIILSPYSISVMLTMVAEGAVDQTLDQMIDAMHIPNGGLADIHFGQRGLRDSLIPVVPPALAARVAVLRAKLKETNEQTTSLHQAKQFKQTYESMQAAEKLAEEINSIVDRISACELQIASAMWVEQSYPIAPQFLSVIEPIYGTTIFPVEFKTQPELARLEINSWVAQQTSNRIENLLHSDSFTNLTRLLITNAVYFKGAWAEPFRTERTEIKPFRLSEEGSIDVPLMHQWNFAAASYAAFTATGELFPSPREVNAELNDDDPVLYPDDKGHTMLALDYQGKRFQMIVLLPQSIKGLPDLEASLSYEVVQRWIGLLERRAVNVWIPKFKLETNYQLESVLRSLGITQAFDREAQFDKLTTSERFRDRLRISGIVHRTSVDVNEVGTEAAAATIVEFDSVGEFLPPTRPFTPIFKADRPFMFLIRDRHTASILFWGRYITPSVAAVSNTF
ncbi:MAG: serpin family protein [Planctomycetaceae bacterium]